MPERQFVIRRKVGTPVWLTQEDPITWGSREDAVLYASEHEARRHVVPLGFNATITVELASRMK